MSEKKSTGNKAKKRLQTTEKEGLKRQVNQEIIKNGKG